MRAVGRHGDDALIGDESRVRQVDAHHLVAQPRDSLEHDVRHTLLHAEVDTPPEGAVERHLVPVVRDEAGALQQVVEGQLGEDVNEDGLRKGVDVQGGGRGGADVHRLRGDRRAGRGVTPPTLASAVRLVVNASFCPRRSADPHDPHRPARPIRHATALAVLQNVTCAVNVISVDTCQQASHQAEASAATPGGNKCISSTTGQ